MLTREAVIRFSGAATRFADDLVLTAQRCELNTEARAAAFLAQLAHESGGFRQVVENLNYGLSGLRATFPKYFPTESLAATYARQPGRIACLVYANRLGNGSEASGDGWTFRGRGLIQITGRDNYRQCSIALYGDDRLLLEPELLELAPGACASAGWFWTSRELNKLADAGDFDMISRRINGGTHGLEDRRERFEEAKEALRSPA